MEVRKIVNYTIVSLWVIASLLNLKENDDPKNFLMLVASMALFIEAFI